MSKITIDAFPLGMPLYKEVERKISEAIHLGEWRPGEVIPAEPKLAQRFGVSMGTLRKAIDELADKGMLIRQQGRGTFVSKHGKDRYLFAFFHVVRQDGYKEYPQVALIDYAKTKASAEAARLLGGATGAPLVRLINTLSLDGGNVIVDEIFLPEAVFPAITKKHVQERQGTLYQLYQEEFGVTVIRTEERLRAVKADAFKANLLGVPIGDPLLQVIRVARSFRNAAVELRFSYINTAHHEYYAELLGTAR
jgi:GntR family transcriptional regulator